MNHFAQPLQFLAREGFTLAAPRARQAMTIEQIQGNLYGYLDDFAPLNFRFIRYPDQAVTATETATGQAFECFGRCELGALASDGQGRVWLLVRDRESFEGRARVFANATLAQFVACYCRFVASIYRLKSQMQAAWGGLEAEAADLAAQIERIEANATEAGSFWAHLVYLIEDDFFYYRLPLSQYMEDGRWGG